RLMAPKNVWLMLIPVFNIVWQFIIVNKISESVEADAREKGLSIPPKPEYSIGIALCILSCLCWIPMLNYIILIGYLVCWIIYWVKVDSFKKLLISKKD